MKRIICLTLVFMLLFVGCSSKEKAKFYYCRSEFQYDTQDSVIVSEMRDVSGHIKDLSFLISLYLVGPLEKESISPFPAGVKLLRTQFVDGNLMIVLSAINSITDSDYTLACACLAMTCLELTNANNVTIVSGNRSVTIDPSMLTLYDSGLPTETTTGG